MKDKDKRKQEQQSPAQRLKQASQDAPSLAPPQFKLEADQPIQKKDGKDKEKKAKSTPAAKKPAAPAPTSGNGIPNPNAPAATPGGMPAIPGLQNGGLSPIPNFQLQPTGPMSGMDPEILQQMQLLQSLRRRTPFVGGLLSEEQLLNLWHTPPGSTYEWDNGESGNVYDLYSDEQIDEQMLMGRVLQQRYPTLPGWEWGLNDMGAGGTWTFGNGSELNMGAWPYFGEDDAAQFPWMQEDEDAPLIQGGTAGFQYRW